MEKTLTASSHERARLCALFVTGINGTSHTMYGTIVSLTHQETMAQPVVNAVTQLLRDAFPSDAMIWSGNMDDESSQRLTDTLHDLRLTGNEQLVLEAVFGPTSDLSKPARDYFSAWISIDTFSRKDFIKKYIEFLEAQPEPVYLNLFYWIHCPVRFPTNLGWKEHKSEILSSLERSLGATSTSYDRDYVLQRALAEEVLAHTDSSFDLVTLDVFCRRFENEYCLPSTMFKSWDVARRARAYDVLFSKLGYNVFRYFGVTELFRRDEHTRIPCSFDELQRIELFAYYLLVDDANRPVLDRFELKTNLDSIKSLLQALKAISKANGWEDSRGQWCWCRPIEKNSFVRFVLAFGEDILSDESEREFGVSLFEQLSMIIPASVVRRIVAEWWPKTLVAQVPEFRDYRNVNSVWRLADIELLQEQFAFLLVMTRGDPVTWSDYCAVESTLLGFRRTVEDQACLMELFDRVKDDSISDSDIIKAIDYEVLQQHVSRRDILRRIREPHAEEITHVRQHIRARMS